MAYQAIPSTADADGDGIADASIITVDETNLRVGINDTTPDAELDVSHATAACNVHCEAVTDAATTYAAFNARVAGTTRLNLAGLGPTWTPSGAQKASCGYVAGIGAGGLSLAATTSTGDVRIYAGGFADGDLCATFADDQTVTVPGRFLATKLAAGNGTAHVFGDALDSATGWTHQVEIGSLLASCGLRIGQGASNNLGFGWTYNGTPANAVGILNTYGYSNPIHIDASTILIQVNSAGNLGFFTGAAGAAKQTVTGSRGANAALASLLTALAAYGLVTDSSS